MNKTKIEWTDMSWNPVTGCEHTCPYCYARAISKRFGRSFEPQFHEGRLAQPHKKKKPQRIFVCSMADLFGAWVPQDWIDSVFKVAIDNPHHSFQFLTKNPARLVEFDWPDNCWAGASTTDRKQFDIAMKTLPAVNAKIRFISAEPLLEEVRYNGWAPEWTIIGGQTGARPSEPPQDWVHGLTKDARRLGSAVFYKPNIHGYESSPKEFPFAHENL